MKRLLLLMLLCCHGLAETVRSVRIEPTGAAVVVGSSVAFHARCSYASGPDDDCTRGGGAVWNSSRTGVLAVGSSGLAVWRGEREDPAVGLGYVLVSAGGQHDRAQVLAQRPGDRWTQYMTPDVRRHGDNGNAALRLPTVVVGATVTIGSGIVVNDTGPATGVPFHGVCDWSSSDGRVATVDRHGQLLARSAGTVTVTCGRAGSAQFTPSTAPGWQAPGNTVTLEVVDGGRGARTWYVRPDGGSPFVDGRRTPHGQCDGLHDAPYPGSGVDRPCAVGHLRDLWMDGVTPNMLAWRISGGDTVLVAPNPAGYRMNLDAPSPYEAVGSQVWTPVNCKGNQDCSMPTVPSGTAARPTRILGSHFAQCEQPFAKTKLLISYAGKAAFDVTDSQFVEIGCFEITDQAACAQNGNFQNHCGARGADYGNIGILQSALTSEVHYADLFLHGLASRGVLGASGVGVVADRISIRAMPDAGIDMDDTPWNVGNISVAGGWTMRYSTTEFAGCVEEFPVRHHFPLLECRDEETGGYGDGFGTGSTTGSWSFDHDVWRYNFQDGLDLLHSGMQRLTLTNSEAVGNDGQGFKIGASDEVIFRHNVVVGNCRRVTERFGDEPGTAEVPGIAPCRAAGGWVVLEFTDQGRYTVERSSLAGYGATPFGLGCAPGWDQCAHAMSLFRGNVVLGYRNPLYNYGQPPALFYRGTSTMPPHQGWAMRDHNLFFNVRFRYCPWPLQTGESCNTQDPLFLVEPQSPIRQEAELDAVEFAPADGSPLLLDMNEATRERAGLSGLAPAVIGALEPRADGWSVPGSRPGSAVGRPKPTPLHALLSLAWQGRPHHLRLRWLGLLCLLVAAGAALGRRRGR